MPGCCRSCLQESGSEGRACQQAMLAARDELIGGDSWLAGLPNNDQRWFCPSDGATCYFYNATGGTISDHRSACTSMGGYIVAYNTGEGGQRRVEVHCAGLV